MYFTFMSSDHDLKLVLREIVNYAVSRIESVSDPKTKRCIFHEYKEWLGSSIDDWVLVLPNNTEKSERNFY